jgi:hypothetical protein
MDIAIIGTGSVGAALGRGWSRAGHRIHYGVANPGDPKHARAASEAGNAELAGIAEAAAAADAIVLAVPWDAVPSVTRTLGDIDGKLVMDVTNPLRMGAHGLELAVGFDASGGEAVAAWLPRARVVKTMNQVGFMVMDATGGYPTAPSMFVAGDDEGARKAAMTLVADLGFAPVDAGPMRVARLLEPYAMLWIHMAVNQGSSLTGAFALMKLPQGGPS